MTFKDWVVGHNAETDWDFNNPKKLYRQLVGNIKESGYLDLKYIFLSQFSNDDTGLTVDQNQKFMDEEYW